MPPQQIVYAKFLNAVLKVNYRMVQDD